ncbi:MAG: S-layer homology domain-containing protein [Acidimicrobiia bacterium]|nr:S-layer homology domain-containing protein [Acidimicrobiia bacterium]MDH4306031.1 S-layer homology domain-containing protein [Acidimicrobiia bacterium]MDH5292149.1 S-layer homology domain-containing protein [Acidimicrobiia bacterium]
MRGTLRTMVAVAALTAMFVVPATVWAIDKFTDVPDSNVFHDDIAWLADAGVTKGCNPPDNTQFCPSDNVTREQMAAFMRRLAENQVVDAGTLGGNDPAYYTAVAAAQGYDYFAPGVGNTALASTGTPIVETTISVPNDGFLLVTSQASMGNSGTVGSFYTMWLEVDDGSCAIAGLIPANPIAGTTVYHADGDEDDFSQASSGLAEVTSGDHTVTLCGANDAADGDAFNAAVNALYVPTGSTDVRTAGSAGGPAGGPNG